VIVWSRMEEISSRRGDQEAVLYDDHGMVPRVCNEHIRGPTSVVQV
jgi:hypothetical protein